MEAVISNLKSIQARYPDAVEIVQTARVLHDGWEMDNEAWAVRMKDGSVKLFTTDHGGIYPMEEDEAQKKIDECMSSVASIQKLLDVLK